MVVTVRYNKRRLTPLMSRRVRPRSASWSNNNLKAPPSPIKKRKFSTRPKSLSFTIGVGQNHLEPLVSPISFHKATIASNVVVLDRVQRIEVHMIYSYLFASVGETRDSHILQVISGALLHGEYIGNSENVDPNNLMKVMLHQNSMHYLVSRLAVTESCEGTLFKDMPEILLLQRLSSVYGLFCISRISNSIRTVLYEELALDLSSNAPKEPQVALLNPLTKLLFLFRDVVRRVAKERHPDDSCSLIEVFHIFLSKTRQISGHLPKDVLSLLTSTFGFLIKIDAPKVLDTIVARMVRSWPQSGSAACMIYLDLIDTFIHLTNHHYFVQSPICMAIFKRLVSQLSSHSSQCVRRTLAILSSPHVLMNYIAPEVEIHQLVASSLFENSRTHWCMSVRERSEELFDILLDYA